MNVGADVDSYVACCTEWYMLHVLSKGSFSLHEFACNIRADCPQCTLVTPLNSSANAAPTSVQALMSAAGRALNY